MNSSRIIKIVIALVSLMIVGGLVYYFMFNPSAKYSKMVGNADELFLANQLDESRKLYEKALEIKSDETYPRRRIVVIDSIKRQTELQIRYDEKIQKADQLFDANDYLGASQYYFDAANIFPDADYPLDQIKLIQKLLKDPSYVEPEKKPLAHAKVEPQKTKSVQTDGGESKTQSAPAVQTKTTPVKTTASQNNNRVADGKYFHVIVGVFSDHQKAIELNNKLIGEGRESQIIYRPGKLEAVSFGSYNDLNTASSFLKFVKNDINKDAWVLYYEVK
ncbi:MAG: hypothetical protein K9H16_12005 [Bacteroidales bacterium]|nr:hypothetical protein [Bacteroidales bacterium]